MPKKVMKRKVRIMKPAERARRAATMPTSQPTPQAAQRKAARIGRSAGKRGGGLFSLRETDGNSAAKYLAAVLDPFADIDPLPKVPDEICVRTLSVRCKVAQNVSPVPTGGNGAGNLVVAMTPIFNVWDSIIIPPAGGAANTTVPTAYFKEMYPVCYAQTAGSFDGSGNQIAWDGGLQWQVSPDSLYPQTGGSGGAGDGVLSEARCVAAGLRITFTGNYTNTDGLFYAAVIPKNAIVPFWYYLNSAGQQDESGQHVTAPRNISEILNSYGVQAFAAQGGVEVNWVPQDPQSVTFTQIGKDAARRKTQIAMYGVSGVTPVYETYEQLNAVPSVFVWGANLNAGASFLLESTAVFEATLAPGLSSFLPSTPSPVDVGGFGKALRVASAVPSCRPSPRSFGGAVAQSGAFQQATGALRSIASGAASQLITRGTGALGGLVDKGLSSLFGALGI